MTEEQYYLRLSQLHLHLLHQLAESSRLLVPFSLGREGDAVSWYLVPNVGDVGDVGMFLQSGPSGCTLSFVAIKLRVVY